MALKDYFWPIQTGKTVVDAWTLIHLAFWFVVGGNLGSFEAAWWVVWPIFIVGAILWEVVEKYIVTDRLGWVRHPEGWVNSWVSDIIAAPVGGWAGYYLILYTGGL